MKKVGILLLAAGNSSRMGQPKQLLQWQGTSLLRYMACMACAAPAESVTVVLGFQSEACKALIEDLPTHSTVNEAWEEGMGSSISFGVAAMINQNSDLEGILIMLCDQIAVTTTVISNMIHSFQKTECDLVVSQYGEAQGPPVLFSKSLFSDLLQLRGAKGAKAVWEKATSITRYDFPLGTQDMDTLEEYNRLCQVYKQH